jgi:enoyl-CoA hydratase/carnithine racemase
MEPLVRTDLEGGIVRLSLATGQGNPLTPDLFGAFDGHLGDLEMEPPRALILDQGEGRLFSGGFDLKTVLGFKRREMLYFMRAFVDTLARLVALDAPTVAAIGGHAIAGGFILALATDLRVVGLDEIKLGLSEVGLGVAVPASAQVLLEARTSAAARQRLSLFAQMITPEEAQDLGYADAVDDDPKARALSLARMLAEKPGTAASASKRFSARTLADQMRLAEARYLDDILDTWFSDAAQTRLKVLAERL